MRGVDLGFSITRYGKWIFMCAKIKTPRTKVICRFSCGAASAVATKLAIKKYGEVEIYYNDTGSEHPDNVRFMKDCEEWFGQPVHVLKSEKYDNIWEVFEARKFLVGVGGGAPCTSEMKRIPGEKVWNPGDVEVFGYTVEERARLERFKAHNTERIIECPLIDKHMDKADCLGMLERVGIDFPVMYKLGFRNNNCIGCVKARDSIDYWKRVRKHFPDHFNRTAKLERKFGFQINRITINGERTPIYLDEVEDGEPTGADPKISCGLFCMVEADEIDE